MVSNICQALLTGELFSGEFYGHLKRLLAPKGRLYHYIGDPASKSAGQGLSLVHF